RPTSRHPPLLLPIPPPAPLPSLCIPLRSTRPYPPLPLPLPPPLPPPPPTTTPNRRTPPSTTENFWCVWYPSRLPPLPLPPGACDCPPVLPHSAARVTRSFFEYGTYGILHTSSSTPSGGPHPLMFSKILGNTNLDNVLPPVSSTKRCNKNGVDSFPLSIPFSSASSIANPTNSSISAPENICSCSGIGTANTIPMLDFNCLRCACIIRAAPPYVSTFQGLAILSVSKCSRVRGMSSIDLAPPQTTLTGVRPSSVRSGLISCVFCTPRCTPPIPPVTNTSIPASFAAIIVPLTVVAPSTGSCCCCLLSNTAKSRVDAFTAFRPVFANRSKSPRESPTHILPSINATVAGTAWFLRITSSTAIAVSKFCGYGIPWLIIVDSSATTGSLFANASFTAGLTLTRLESPLVPTTFFPATIRPIPNALFPIILVSFLFLFLLCYLITFCVFVLIKKSYFISIFN
ncbi:hypothetical protein AX774_g3381, partial [Zancudomyces culisetae]